MFDGRVSRSRPFLLPILLALLPAAVVLAGNHVWTGAGTPAWSDPGSWTAIDPNDPNSGGPPVPGEPFPVIVTFPPGAANRLNSLNLVGLTINGLDFEGPSCTLFGNPFTMSGTIASDPNSPFVDHYVFPNATLGQPLVTNVGNAASGLVLYGGITGPHGITTGGGGFTVLGGGNSYTGTTTVSSGTLRLISPLALGTPAGDTSVLGGATLELSSYAQDPNSPEMIHFLPTSRLSAGGVSTVAYLDLPGPGAVNGAFVPGATLNVGCLIGSGPLTQNGGTLRITGTSPFSGTITVGPSTTLFVGGNMPNGVVVLGSPGSVLLGNGTVGSVTVTAGRLAPGGSPGVLNVAGAASLSGASSTFDVELNGTALGSGYDRLAVTGALTLASPVLNVTRGFLPTAGTVFTIATAAGGVGGTFAGLPDNATFLVSGQLYQVDYTATDVTLTAVTSTPVELQRLEAD